MTAPTPDRLGEIANRWGGHFTTGEFDGVRRHMLQSNHASLRLMIRAALEQVVRECAGIAEGERREGHQKHEGKCRSENFANQIATAILQHFGLEQKEKS